MKAFFFALCLLPASVVFGETIDVHSCTEHLLNPKKPRDYTTYTSLGTKITQFDTGPTPLREIIEKARPDSWKGEPFYGPVKKYVFKDSAGRLFIVHFEYVIGHRTFGKGMRFATIELKKIPGTKDKYSGDPYVGVSVFDKGLLERLRELADRRAKEGKDD